MAAYLGEGKLWIKTCKTPHKIDLVSHTARALGWYIYIYTHIYSVLYLLQVLIDKYFPVYILRN